MTPIFIVVFISIALFFLLVLIVSRCPWPIYLVVGVMLAVFSTLILASIKETEKRESEFNKKYPKETIFYKVEYRDQQIVMVNPQMKENVLSDDVIILNASKGYKQITREEAMKFIK